MVDVQRTRFSDWKGKVERQKKQHGESASLLLLRVKKLGRGRRLTTMGMPEHPVKETTIKRRKRETGGGVVFGKRDY